MSVRSIALLVVLGGAIVAACYDVPTPDCGFRCGPDSACPDNYTCASDHHCHRIGTPANLVCSTPDAAVPNGSDAAVDGASDTMSDAPVDAMVDAPVDAPVDVMDDAPGSD